MDATSHTEAADDAAAAAVGLVEIRVRGHLDSRWSDWFDQLTISTQDDGTTLIHGPVVDQAALFGVLQRLRDLALPLISVVHSDPRVATPRDAPVVPATPADPPTPSHPSRSTS
jgi:hypothetical protein